MYLKELPVGLFLQFWGPGTELEGVLRRTSDAGCRSVVMPIGAMYCFLRLGGPRCGHRELQMSLDSERLDSAPKLAASSSN